MSINCPKSKRGKVYPKGTKLYVLITSLFELIDSGLTKEAVSNSRQGWGLNSQTPKPQIRQARMEKTEKQGCFS